MARIIDQIAAGFVILLGFVHLAVGHQSFANPTERGVWFLSAGFLLILIGLTNLTRARAAVRSGLQSLAALVGALFILIMAGLMIAASDPGMLFEPATLALVGVGLMLAGFSLRDLLRRS